MHSWRDVVVEAKKLNGQPFLHQGRGDLGLDCAGVVIRIMQALGQTPEDCLDYTTSPDPALLIGYLRRNCDEAFDAATGGILTFDFGSLKAQHVGVLVARDQFRMVHAFQGKGVVEEHLTASWLRRVAGFWRFRKVDYRGAC